MACTLAMGCQVRGLVGSNLTDSEDTGVVDETSGAAVTSTTASTVTSPTSAPTTDDTTTGETTGDVDSTDGFVWDVQPNDVPEICAPPQTRWCDLDDDAWHNAMGFSCDDVDMIAFESSVQPGALHVHHGPIGSAGIFVPQQSEKMVILSTGLAEDVPMPLPVLQAVHPECTPIDCPNSSLGSEVLHVLPEPLQVRRVSEEGVDCSADPALVGQGDCSNSLEEHWVQGNGAYDYSELRVRATVPATADAFQYEFAFFSSEYPNWISPVHLQFNDMYVAWLESEAWTGNVSFDEDGNPITVHSVLLDYRTASEVCSACQAPELAGFSMEQHAGTKWLTTRAPVEPGEEIELVFAIFDLSDSAFDSVVLLDGFQWTCADGPPVTWAG